MPRARATWIEFIGPHPSPSGKTQTWFVAAKGGNDLGEIRWFGRWRCYAFFPDDGTVFERKCLRDIADFCERESQARKRNV